MSHRKNIRETYLDKAQSTYTTKGVYELLKHAIINEDDSISIERVDDLVKNIKLIKNWVGDKQSKEGNDVLLDFEVKLDATGKSRFFKIKHGTGDNFFSIYLYDENKKGKSLLSITKEGKVICDDIQLLKSVTVGDDKLKGKIISQELVVNNIYGKTTDNKKGNEAVEIDEKGNVKFRENVVFEGVISSQADKFLANGKWQIIKDNVQQFDLYEFYCSSMNTNTQRNYLTEFLISIGQKPNEKPTEDNNLISPKHHFYTKMNRCKIFSWLLPAKKWNNVKVAIRESDNGIAICAKADPRIHDIGNEYIYYSIKKLWDRKLFNEPVSTPRPTRRIEPIRTEAQTEKKTIVIKGVRKNQSN